METIKVLDTTQKSEEVKHIEEGLKHRIIGQPHAIEAVTDVLEKVYGGLSPENKPIGSLLFLGPTGTGKTRIVESLSEVLHGNEYSMTRVDCAEFKNDHDVQKLMGSPPGYIGHSTTVARLAHSEVYKPINEKVPYAIVLFDEIEKANSGLWDLLLGILDKGRLTTGENKTTDFSKSIIFMTSNVGSKEMDNALGSGIGFKGSNIDKTNSEVANIGIEAAKRKFTPEFINRLDRIVPFNVLVQDNLRHVIKLELSRLQYQIAKASPFFIMDVSEAVKEDILNEGFNPKYNARGIKRVIEKKLQIPFSRIIASKQITSGAALYVDIENGEYTFKEVDKLPATKLFI